MYNRVWWLPKKLLVSGMFKGIFCVEVVIQTTGSSPIYKQSLTVHHCFCGDAYPALQVPPHMHFLLIALQERT